jgi:hypothetical protein
VRHALVAGKQFGGEGAVAHLGHPQDQPADARRQFPRPVAVAVALPLLGPFVRRRLELLGDLRLEHLVQDRLQELAELILAAREEPLQGLRIKRNLVVGHGRPLCHWVFEPQPVYQRGPAPPLQSPPQSTEDTGLHTEGVENQTHRMHTFSRNYVYPWVAITPNKRLAQSFRIGYIYLSIRYHVQ